MDGLQQPDPGFAVTAGLSEADASGRPVSGSEGSSAESCRPVERHPFEPFLPEKAKVLMLGSFPPQPKRWSIEFYYPNFINDMWRIMGLVFFGDKNRFVDIDARKFRLEDIVDFCTGTGIAMYDTASAVRRLKDNASDKFLEVVTPTDVPALLREIPQCQAIVTTGEKATLTLCETFGATAPQGPGIGRERASEPHPSETFGVTAPQGTGPRPARKKGEASAAGYSAPALGEYSEFIFEGRRMRLYRMPSSSRAYPLSLDRKAAAYRRLFSDLGMV